MPCTSFNERMRNGEKLRITNYGITELEQRAKNQRIENEKLKPDSNRVDKISIPNGAGYNQQTNNQQLTTIS